MAAAICAILIPAAAAAGSATVCRFPGGAGQGATALPGGHAEALAHLCRALQPLLAGRPELTAQGEVQLQLMRSTPTAMTLRLAQQRGDRQVAGRALDLQTVDSTRFSPQALDSLAGLLVRHGPPTDTPQN